MYLFFEGRRGTPYITPDLIASDSSQCFLFQVLPDFLVAILTFLYVDNSLSVLFKLVLLSKF